MRIGNLIIFESATPHDELKTELASFKRRADEMMYWCAYDSPEIGFAMLNLIRNSHGVGGFREELRRGLFNFDSFKEALATTPPKELDDGLLQQEE